ncbi:MAG: trypsin-like serine protease [Jannaschia sp.]
MTDVIRSRISCTIGALMVTAIWPVGLYAQDDQAQDGGVTASPTIITEASEAEAYWTQERFQEVVPLDLPTPEEPGPQGLPLGFELISPELTTEIDTLEAGQEGSPPLVDPGEALSTTIAFDPDLSLDEEGGPSTEASSSFGAHFTTRQVPATVEKSYPYRTVGKLFFRDSRRGTNHVCSAAVLRPRVVATAGHCVTSPSTNAADRYFFTNFLFVPSYNQGQAPYGRWTSSQQWVSNNWHFSNGSVPNRGDIAMLVMRDQEVRGTTQRIGAVTGWLGWRSNALQQNHITMLGYPCNLASCQRMIETGAGTFSSGGQNTYTFGSSGRGGHSGGPFIQDFGVAPAGSPPASSGLNRLVGITSYGPTATEPKYLGASNFDNNFTSLLNSACNASSGNC